MDARRRLLPAGIAWLRLAIIGGLTFSTLSLWAVPLGHVERRLIKLTAPEVRPSDHIGVKPAFLIRVNQVGYTVKGPKIALLMSTAPLPSTAYSVDHAASGASVYTGAVGPSRGAWSDRFGQVYPLDLTALQTPGDYRIRVGRTESLPFRIDTPAHLYGKPLTNAVTFFQAQRDGAHVVPSIMRRKPSHLNDREAYVYDAPPYRWIDSEATGELTGAPRIVDGPVDVAGGWFDAGDYLKFVETASFNTMLMWLAVDRSPHIDPAARQSIIREARYGTDWLLKMWDPMTRTLYYQVGLGDGNDDIHGDHDVWRLPTDDDDMRAGDSFFVRYRPVFRAAPPGSPVSPNLAGRMAATFALAARLYAHDDSAYADRCATEARQIYAMADTHPVGRLTTASIFEYYPEVEWRDDMAMGAVELTRMSVERGDQRSAAAYLQDATRWTSAYLRSPEHGHDTLNLYDCAGLAEYELCKLLRSPDAAKLPVTLSNLDVTQADLVDDLGSQVRVGLDRSAHDPFRLAVRYDRSDDQTAHALGLTIEADCYAELTRRQALPIGASVTAAQCRDFRAEEINWVLGENAWGSSYIIGDGTVYPMHPHHQIANLTVGPDGESPTLAGAAVNGPVPRADIPTDSSFGALNGMRTDSHVNRFADFDNAKARYVDRVDASECVEPCDDCTALSLLLFARLAGR